MKMFDIYLIVTYVRFIFHILGNTYIYNHIHTFTHTHTNKHSYTRPLTNTSAHTYTHTQTHTHIHKHIFTHMYVYSYAHIAPNHLQLWNIPVKVKKGNKKILFTKFLC